MAERNRVEHTINPSESPDGVTVVLTGAHFECTKCGLLKPATEFGLRAMPDNKIRNQPQCISCRGGS